MKTTQHKQQQAELKALLEEEQEAKAERKRLKEYYKQRSDTVVAGALWGMPLLERGGTTPLERQERAEAAQKKDEKRYRENAKEKLTKTAEAAQAEEWAVESM